MRRLALLLLAAGLLGLAGCAQPGGTPALGPTPDSLLPMTVTRTGGIGGVNDTLRLEPDGAWTLNTRSGPAQTGRIDAAAVGRITKVLAAPGLDDEIAKASAPNQCADQFQYRVTLSGRRFSFDDCGQVGPLLRELLDTLHSATGF